MNRREFIVGSSGLAISSAVIASDGGIPQFKTPQEAIKSAPERHLFTTCNYVGTNTRSPDYLAVVDVDPTSKNYSQIVHRLPMKQLEDELHHFGWNTGASSEAKDASRRYLIVPGLKSGRIYIVDALSPTSLKLHKILEPLEIKNKTNLSAPHTVRCLPDGQSMISMLGDADGSAPGGFLLLDEKFNIAGHWGKPNSGMKLNCDFWYQPRKNVMLSTEWAAPLTYQAGYSPKDVAAGKYGSRITVWDWKERQLIETLDVAGIGDIPLGVRFLHNPEKANAFVASALSSAIIHVHKPEMNWKAETVIQVQQQKLGEQNLPGMITDLVMSMDDRYLYFSNWLHGDIRQYDISNPTKPRLTGQLFVAGKLGKGLEIRGASLLGGPQKLQLSLDGKRLYVTNSFYSKWDNQLYPELATQGSWMLQIDCDTVKGGLKRNEKFFIDFGKEPNGPSRAREMHYPGGDCTSDIFS